jgi:hypothetical protein
MNRPLTFCLLCILLIFAGTLSSAFGEQAATTQPPPPPPPPPLPEEQLMAQTPPLQMVSPGVYAIDGCRILKDKNRIEFPAEVNMDKGLLEYVLVGNTGKLHESLLRTKLSPYSLQIALLLAGFEGSTDPLIEQGQNKTPQGQKVHILVSWQDQGKEKKIPVEEWISKGDKPVTSVPWVYTGSIVVNGMFLAQIEKSLIAVFHDPTALIDHQLSEGNNDEIWQVKNGSTPPIGTPVTIIIEKKN